MSVSAVARPRFEPICGSVSGTRSHREQIGKSLRGVAGCGGGWTAVAESDFWHRAKPRCPAFTRASPIRLPSDRKNSAPMIAEQRAYATNAERSRHHTEEKQRFVVSVVACDSLLGHQRSRPADGAGKASEHVIPVIARRACRVRPSNLSPVGRRREITLTGWRKRRSIPASKENEAPPDPAGHYSQFR